MKKKVKKIAICLAHNYQSFDKNFVMSLLQMQHYFLDWERISKTDYLLSIIVQGGYQLDWMRNEVTERALEEHDILLYLDTDMSFPIDTIPRMLLVLESNLKHNAVTGVYTHKTPPYAPQLFLNWDKKSKSYNAIRDGFPMKRPFSLEASGAGILMVKKEVFKNKKRPWFKMVMAGERKDLPSGLGEDLYFFKYLKPKLLCDPKIICDHFGIQSANLQNYIEFNNASLKTGVIKLTKKKLNNIEKMMGKTPILRE